MGRRKLAKRHWKWPPSEFGPGRRPKLAKRCRFSGRLDALTGEWGLAPQQFGVSIPQIFLKRGSAELALVLCCARRLEATSASAPRCLRMMEPSCRATVSARLVPRERVWTARWAARWRCNGRRDGGAMGDAMGGATGSVMEARWAVHWAAQ